MANFTELHLGNNSQDPKKSQNSKNTFSKEKALFGAGLIAVTAVSGVFLLITNGCSKGSSKAPTAISAPAPVAQEVASPAPVVATQPQVVAPKPLKKRVQRTAPTYTFTEPNYGVSFKYPKSYILKTGDEPQQLDLAGLGPVKTNYIAPGGVTVAAIELPRSSYPGTDFTSAYFGMSVNPSMSKDSCEAFAFPKSEHPENEPSLVSRVKIAGKEYSMVEDQGVSEKQEARLKYFHHFENGNCYEFSMGLGTTDANVAGLKPVNRSLVFGRMEQMLATVKWQPIAVPEVAKDSTQHPIVEGGKE
jgi:hypothetical protein